MTRLLLSAALGSTLALVASPAFAHTSGTIIHRQETVASGGVSATLSYDEVKGQYGFESASNLVLTISRRGTVLLTQKVPPYSKQESRVQPNNAYFTSRKSVWIRRLDGSPDPEVALDLNWGGAHCCEWTRVYRYNAGSGRYTVAQHLWGDPGYRLQQVQGHPLFVSADDAFAYAFTDFADSLFPVQLWSYTNGKFTNMTRHYPTLISPDAAKLWAGFRNAQRAHREPRGWLAAWAADEFALGYGAQTTAQLNQVAASGALNIPPGVTADIPADPHACRRAPHVPAQTRLPLSRSRDSKPTVPQASASHSVDSGRVVGSASAFGSPPGLPQFQIRVRRQPIE